MISAYFFDHTVAVWGAQETRGADFGEPGRRWSPVYGQSAVRIALQLAQGTIQNDGPGERAVERYNAYGPADMDVQQGDVIEVKSGPQAPTDPGECKLLKVDAPPYRPFGRHTELVLIHWDGEL